MSQDVFPIQIRATAFILTCLCANAEIGVHRGRIASLRHSCSSLPSFLLLSPSFLLLPPPFLLLPPPFLLLPPVIPAPPSRHSCEGRNLNQDVDVSRHTSP